MPNVTTDYYKFKTAMNIVLKSVLVSQYENESKRRRTFNGISLQWGTVSAPGPLISQCQWSTPNQFISAVCRVDEKPPGNQWQRFRSDPVSCPAMELMLHHVKNTHCHLTNGIDSRAFNWSVSDSHNFQERRTKWSVSHLCPTMEPVTQRSP